MIKINENYYRLQGSYLFSEIANRVNKYMSENPGKKIIKLGIGDVNQPLVPAVLEGLQEGVNEMGSIDTFKGYRSDKGYEFLRDAIRDIDFISQGINIDSDEIFISTGAKEDTANFQELFATDTKIAIPDPVYTVYVDSNVMAGRSGDFKNGRFTNFVYLDSNVENDFKPGLPQKQVDLIYLCYPNNPTGQVLTKDELKRWVDYARENRALIMFDAAYEAFIREKNIPHSIFEIDGAKEVAVEFRSLSKTAGFTGTRCSYTIVPKEAMIFDNKGEKHSLNDLWDRRQATKFNGVAYIIQKGAHRVFTQEGQSQIKELIDYYLGNAGVIRNGFESLGLKCTGGLNSPYIWLKTPDGYTSWGFFDKLLNEKQVVGTPGVGFGKCGEGYFRLSALGNRQDVEEAIIRIKGLNL